MRPILLLLMAALVAGGCGGDARREVRVSAAASLSDAFLALETQYEAERPEVDIVLNLGGSSALREQILSGAPVGVFASANQANLEQLVTAGLVDGPVVDFATNRLTIAVPAGNPADVRDLADLARDNLLIGLCSPAVPCGDYAATALAIAGVVAAPDTLEPDVRALLTKIRAGELDAGVVYETDIAAAGDDVESVAIPAEINVPVVYSIAAIAEDHRSDAENFIDFVVAGRGRQILRDQGFFLP
ncbi:MAG: molybdate ABC transporter substrate-binding protein [Acidimicrobiia bacterium]|nr:molybdate ABC transporter substrate-binding protein [Acidimicrobiia bacterium]